jgi:hypothetical protein
MVVLMPVLVQVLIVQLLLVPVLFQVMVVLMPVLVQVLIVQLLLVPVHFQVMKACGHVQHSHEWHQVLQQQLNHCCTCHVNLLHGQLWSLMEGQKV